MGIDKILEKIGVTKPSDNSDNEEALQEPVQEENSQEEAMGNTAGRDVSSRQSPRRNGAFVRHNRNLDKVVDITATAASIREAGESSKVSHGEPMKVVVIQPRSLDDSQQIANCLKERRPVVINFEGVDDQLYRRILDFVSGTTYALDGSVNSISTRVWLFSPKNVDVSVSKQTNTSYSDMPWEKNK